MNSFKTIKIIFLITLTILTLDYIYLSSFSQYFSKVFERIQSQKLELFIPGVIMCYICIVFSIYYFGFVKNMSNLEMFILGFLIYAIYETTNFATLKYWPFSLVVLDTIWGGILFSASFFITKMILKQQ